MKTKTPTRIHALSGYPNVRSIVWKPFQKQIRISGLMISTLALVLWFPAITGCRKKTEQPPNADGTTIDQTRESQASLLKLNEALAATENLEPQAADKLWTELASTFPDDPSIAINRALNTVLEIDILTGVATDSGKSPEEKKAARMALANKLDPARDVIAAFAQLSGDDVTKLWLASRIDAHEANLLNSTISRSLRRDLFGRLTSAIQGPEGDQARAVILGGPLVQLLEQMSDPIDGLPANLVGPAAEALLRLSDVNDSNLFLAIEALRMAVQAKSPAAQRLVERTWKLASAIEPALSVYTRPIGMTPEQLKNQIRDAVQENQWDKADQFLAPWSNVLGPSELLRTDRRRATPHPLDQLSFEAVRTLSAELAKANPIKSNDGLPKFKPTSIAENVRLVLPVDADVDLAVDLVTLSNDSELQLWRQENGEWIPFGTTPTEYQATGMLAADLFMVDSSDAGRLKSSPKKKAANGENSTEPDYSLQSRHNTLPGLIMFGDFGVELFQIDARAETSADKRFQRIEKDTGLQDLPGIRCVVTGDLEGDGDLDLIVAPLEGGIRTFVNRGNRTFFEAEVGAVTVDQADPIAAMAIADLDRDLDLDVVTIHANSGRVGILENLLHLQFRLRYLEQVPALPIEDPPASLSVAVQDVDGNVGWDVIASSDQQIQVAFANSADIGVWKVDRVETGKPLSTDRGPAHPVLADLDNDTFFEWLGDASAVRLGPWGITSLAKSQLDLGDTQNLPRDLNADGLVDLVTLDDGKLAVLLNELEGNPHHLSVRFRGIADNAASSGRVNHFGIGSVLELRFGPHYRAMIVTEPATHFGMDGFSAAESIRVIMPNGLTQTIRDPQIDSIIEEDQTLKGSCPYLYAWDGEQFAFVTDCLWAAPLGLQVAAGKVQKDRPWEYLKLPGELVQPLANGQYELRLTEELWEVAYVDHIQLTAVDHPAEVEVFTNEKVGPPNLATPTVFAFSPEETFSVSSARDTDGDDVTETLREADESYVQGFDRRIRQGLCPPHWIDLDFADAATELPPSDASATRRAYLLLRGWILPTDTSLNIQIDQNPELPAIEFPSVWVPDTDAEDGWRKAIPFMGFPGGKTKDIVVDVTEHIDTQDPRFRVRTSAQIYWDRASLVITSNSTETIEQTLELVDAEVAVHGFSQKSKPDATSPETYDYANVSMKPKWPPLKGNVSALGDCTSQLLQWDDEMVVISGGDEIRMRFNPPADPIPEGWKRDFVLHCVGWDKDADLNTLTGQSIGPLPLRDMSGYPPTAESESLFEAVQRRNADSLKRTQSFRDFWYRPAGDRPTTVRE